MAGTELDGEPLDRFAWNQKLMQDGRLRLFVRQEGVLIHARSALDDKTSGPGAPYPSPWIIIRRCLGLDIPLLVTTDAPARVTDSHGKADALLREVGCTHLAVPRDSRWQLESV